MTEGRTQRSDSVSPLRYAASKVPEATVYFWITKVLTTGMGEVLSDYLATKLGSALAVGLSFAALVISLVVQFRVRRYIAGVYWVAVVMVSVFGTMAADVLHSGLGVPYAVSTAGYAIALAIIFAMWYRMERTLSIHSVRTPRREAFYWAAVLATFALGTAAGDLTSQTLGMGALNSAILFAVVIAVPAVAHGRFGMNSILAFWFAYIVTRPLGASLADWMAYGHGGLGWGQGPVTLGWALAIAGFVVFLGVSRTDVVQPATTPVA